jgi:hypothetical protein
MGQTKFAQRAKAKDGFGLFGRAKHGPKDEPQGRGEQSLPEGAFWRSQNDRLRLE